MSSKTIIKEVNINQIITEKVQKLIDDAQKPRSIKEIKEHFQLKFPFYVKRVISPENAVFEGITEVREIEQQDIDNPNEKRLVYCTQNYIQQEYPRKRQLFQSAEIPHYVLVIKD